jgi:hypothetical protein
MRLYIAGPMTGLPRWNFDAFERATARLRGHGFVVISPHEIDLAAGFDPEQPPSPATQGRYRETLFHDIDILAHEVDGIATLPRWRTSPGARAEVAFATAVGMPVSAVKTWVGFGDAEIVPYIRAAA